MRIRTCTGGPGVAREIQKPQRILPRSPQSAARGSSALVSWQHRKHVSREWGGWQRHFFLLINPNPRDVMGLKWPHVQQLLSSPQFPSYTYIHLAALIAILAFILFLIVASRSLSRAQLLQHLRVPACRKRGGKSGMAPA